MSDLDAKSEQQPAVSGMNMDGAGDTPPGSRRGSTASQTTAPGNAGSRRDSTASRPTGPGAHARRDSVASQSSKTNPGKDEYGRDVRPKTEMQNKYPIKEVSKTLELPPEAYHVQTSTPYARRPGYNKQGTDCAVYTNQFRITSMCAVQIYQYHVAISPQPKGPGLIKSIWHEQNIQTMIRAKNPQGYLYDGHHLAWSVNRVPELRLKFDMSERKGRPPGGEIYYLSIKETASIHMSLLQEYLMGKRPWDDHILSCMNILDHAIRQGPSERMMSFRRQFYHKDAKTFVLSHKSVEAIKGIYASVRMSENVSINQLGLGINVDVANSAFFVGHQRFHELAAAWVSNQVPAHRGLPLEKLAEVLAPQTIQPRNGGASYRGETEAFRVVGRLRKLKFRVEHKGRVNERPVFCINNILFDAHGKNTAATKTFEWVQGDQKRNVTVEKYYLEKYGLKLKFPNLPLVSTTKATLFPMEIMVIDRFNRYPFKLTGNETSEMIKFAVTRPPQRSADISKNVEMLDWKNDQWLKQFNIKINEGMDRTKAKILKNPEVQFGNKKLNPGVSGRWDLRGAKFLKPNVQPLKSWAFAVVEGCIDKATAEHFVGQFMSVYRSHGGQIAAPPVLHNYGRGASAEDIVSDVLHKTGKANNSAPQIAFFVLPDANQFTYQRLKKNADCRWALLSQMLLRKHVQKAAGQYISNVCMKVNAKLGGQQTRVAAPGPKSPFFKNPTMMVGVDVSHGSPGDNTPSFAAVTASMDHDAAVYNGACCTNGFNIEIINSNSLSGIMQDHLKAFKKRNGCFPKDIFYLRDGVSDGQFTHVMEAELPSMKHACSEVMGANQIPNFTVIVATKRHHVRIFPEKGDKNGNALPGTLVEREVTHPFHYDFFLCSHFALQGTARPVHYHVLHDEIKYSPDELQKMLYQHCYQFARATTPVSLHPAVYYAHIVGDRARAHENIMSQSIMPAKFKAEGHGFSVFGKYEDASEVRKAQAESGVARALHPLGGPEARAPMPENFRNTMWFI